MTDFLDTFDTFRDDVRHAATRLSYGADVDDPLLRAAGELYLDGFERARKPHPRFSNGALRFSVYVGAKEPAR